MPLWLPPLISFCLTAILLWALLRSGLAYRLAMDLPNERSLHARPIPRIGGLVAVPAALGCALAVGAPALLSVGALLLCLLSYADDRWNLPVVLRFGAHLGVAMAVVVACSPPHPLLLVVLAVLAITWMTNLYNFMDGADGLAGGMAVFGFGALGAAASKAGMADLTLLCLVLAGSAGGFLSVNFPPARVFLGDAGSVPFGFLAGAIGIEGLSRGAWPLWFPLLVFSPFIVDASVTLIRRTVRGEKVWHAHREHYYQRLVRLGWGHKRVALMEYALMLGAALLALCSLDASWSAQAAGLGVWGLFLAVLMLAIDRRWHAATQGSGA